MCLSGRLSPIFCAVLWIVVGAWQSKQHWAGRLTLPRGTHNVKSALGDNAFFTFMVFDSGDWLSPSHFAFSQSLCGQ
jgi:hypothetical protein